MKEVSLGRIQGEDGLNIYIKFNYKPEMDGATDQWQEGMEYIGLISSRSQEKPTEGYSWIKFVGNNNTKLGVVGGAAKYEHSHGTLTYLVGSLSGNTLTLTERTTEIKGA